MSFNNDVSKEISDVAKTSLSQLDKAVSDASKLLLDIMSDIVVVSSNQIENAMKNLNINTKFQECINDIVVVQGNSIKSANLALETLASSFNDVLNQAGHSIEDTVNHIQITGINPFTEVFSAMDIPTFNNCMQGIYDNVPEDISINFNQAELDIAKNVQSCINAYNANSNTNIQIKMPVNKEKICSIFLFITIITILIHSGYHITEHVYSICESILANILYNGISKKD